MRARVLTFPAVALALAITLGIAPQAAGERAADTRPGDSCDVHVLVSGPGKLTRLKGHAELRRWVTPTHVVAEVSIPVASLRRGEAGLAVITNHGAARSYVRQLMEVTPGAVAGVNAGYANTTSFVAEGVLVDQSQQLTILPARDASPMHPRALGVTRDGVPVFGTLFAKGTVLVGKRELKLAAYNSLSSAQFGTVVIDHALGSRRPLALPEVADVARVRNGKVVSVTRDARSVQVPSEGVLLISAKSGHRRTLQDSLGQLVSVRWKSEGSLRGYDLKYATQLGAPLVRNTKRETSCDIPAGSWESRPRVIVGIRATSAGDSFVMMSIRGVPLDVYGQYDSGITLGQMGYLAQRRKLTTAYAMDGGASTQLATESKGRPTLVDRTPTMRFSWERPVPAALAILKPAD